MNEYSGCIDLNNNSICDVYEQMRCETVLLQGKNYLIARVSQSDKTEQNGNSLAL